VRRNCRVENAGVQRATTTRVATAVHDKQKRNNPSTYKPQLAIAGKNREGKVNVFFFDETGKRQRDGGE
jgi:hypothetical protein